MWSSQSRERTLLQRISAQGYYWPTMRTDCTTLAKKCDKCQRFSSIRKTPQAALTPITLPWPFSMWGIDLVGPLSTIRGRFKYLVIAVDYFTKWVEAEPLTDMPMKSCISSYGKASYVGMGCPMFSLPTMEHNLTMMNSQLTMPNPIFKNCIRLQDILRVMAKLKLRTKLCLTG